MDVHQFTDFCKENKKLYALEEPEIVAAFANLDHDDNGHLDFAEFQRWFRLEDGRGGHLRFEAQNHFDKFSKDGRMDVHQFTDFCKENKKAYALEEPEIVAAFVKLDDDNTGYIEFAEFQRWCRLQDGRAGHLRFESAAMQRRVSDAWEAFKREVGSRKMSELQFELHCCKNGMHKQGAHLRTIFQSLDKDSDKNIDFSEYLRWRLKDSPFESDQHYNQGAIDIAAPCFQTDETEPPASRPLPEGSEPVSKLS